MGVWVPSWPGSARPHHPQNCQIGIIQNRGAKSQSLQARAPIQKERATPRIARTFPLRVWHAVSPPPVLGPNCRVQRNPGHQPHDATLTDRFRRATTKSAIHKVVPWKAHLSRFDPPKAPPRQRGQTACKPGSVPPAAPCLWAVMAIPLGRPSPNASCDRPERRREGSPGIFGSLQDACRSYLVLLPVGFSLPPPLPAARCALAAPFHPCRPPGVPGRLAVYFLWHFPWGRPRRALPGTVPPWSPDFPLPAHCGERPSDRLAPRDLGCRDASVKASPNEAR
jgi:hypothetical protein